MIKYFLIVDVEATCDTVNVRENMEIIELGCVLCDENGDVVDEFDTFVKPIVNTKLTDFCKELTHITQEDVDNAPYFKSAMLQMLAWIGDRKPYIFCSWGAYDLHQIMQDCARHGIAYPLGDRHINLKNVYAKIKGLKRHGIANTIKNLGWEWIGKLHRGRDDARNMARVLKLIAKDIQKNETTGMLHDILREGIF